MINVRKVLGKIKRRLFHRWLPKQLELFLIVTNDRDRMTYEIPQGYFIRKYQKADQAQILCLMKICGFSDEVCTKSKFLLEITTCVSRGHFVIEHKASKQIAGTFMARNNSDGIHKNSGKIDYLAVHPDHQGNGLGYALTAVVVNRLIAGGYKIIFVGTEDERLAAIKIYLKAGFTPNLYVRDMFIRWKRISESLGCDYVSEEWTKRKHDSHIYSSIK